MFAIECVVGQFIEEQGIARVINGFDEILGITFTMKTEVANILSPEHAESGIQQ